MPESSRRSGEHTMPDGASEDIRVLAVTVSSGFQLLSERIDNHAAEAKRRADDINQRLDRGSETMKTLEAVLQQQGSMLQQHASSLAGFEQQRRRELTPRSSNLLTGVPDPKPPWYIHEALRAAVTVVATGGTLLILLRIFPSLARAFLDAHT
jgi:hypothetical protein